MNVYFQQKQTFKSVTGKDRSGPSVAQQGHHIINVFRDPGTATPHPIITVRNRTRTPE